MATKTGTNGKAASELRNRYVETEVEADEIPQEDIDTSSVMQLEIVTFKVEGISPLLQNNPAEFIGVEDEGISVGKKRYDDDEEAMKRTYRDTEGNFCHPSECFTKALVKAAAGKKFGKKFATVLLKQAVFTTEPFCLLEDAKGKPLTKYAIDKRGVVVGKSRVPRCRPMWKPWFMRVALEVDVAVVAPAQVKEVLALAGRYPGIGDYRPEKGGSFGRFRVL